MIEVVMSVALRSTALLAVLFGLTFLARRAPAGLRHAVWSFGFLALLALPLLTMATSWRLQVLPSLPIPAVSLSDPVVTQPDEAAPATTGAAGHARRVRAQREPGVERAEASIRPLASSSLAPRSDVGERRAISLAQIAAALWLVGGLFVFGRLVRGAASIGRMARRGRPIETSEWLDLIHWAAARLGLKRRVELVESGAVSLPMTFGLRRPMIVVPRLARGWPESRRRAVLLHELAHIQRRDVVSHWLSWAVCAVYWFHPLAWLAARRLRHECERACDDVVLGVGTRPSDYAGHLLDIVRTAGREVAPAPAVPFAQRSSFEGRLLAILEPGIARGRVGLRRAGGALAAVGLGTLLLTFAAPTQESDEAVAAQDERPAVVRPATVTPTPNPGPDPSPNPAADPRPDADRAVIVVSEVDSRTEIAIESDIVVSVQEVVESGAVIDALAIVLTDREPSVREAAVQALGTFEDPRAVAALMKALIEDADAGVRTAAAYALGEIEDPAAVPALITALQRDSAVEVREAAASALGEIEDPSATDALLAALDDGAPSVRYEVVMALGEIEDPAAAPGLVRLLDDSDPEIREEAAWALGELDLGVAPPELIDKVSDADPDVRYAVIHALADIEDPSTVDLFVGLLRDADPEIREVALWAIDDMAESVSTDVLLELLQDENADVREAAAHALGDHGENE